MITLGTLGLWNLLTKQTVIDGNDETLRTIKRAAPDQFDRLVKQTKPNLLDSNSFGSDPYCLKQKSYARSGK